MVKYFCPKCGKNIKEQELNFYLLNFICLDCYNKDHPLFYMKPEYKINICPECHSYHYGEDTKSSSNWVSTDEEDIVKIIGNSIYLDLITEEYRLKDLNFELELDNNSLSKSRGNAILCNVKGVDKSNKNTMSYECKINISTTLCPNCTKMHGKRFEAVIQLRKSQIESNISENDKIARILKEIQNYVQELNLKNSNLFIVEVVKRKNGYDLQLSSKSLMKKISSYIRNRYYFIVKISKKLVGKNSQTGGDLYRYYILLRLLPISVGVNIQVLGEEYFVKNISSNRVHLENLKTHQNSIKKFDFFEKNTFKILN